MKRPLLVSGTAIGLSTASLVLFGMGALPFLLLGAVSVFVIYFVKPFKLKDKIIIPAICISVFISCIFFGIYHFTKIAPATVLDNTVTDISGKIITTPQDTAYGRKFILKADTIGDTNKSAKINIYLNGCYDIDLKLYDYISLPDAKLKIIRNEYNKPDASFISDGIILEAQTKHCNYLWESEKTPYYYCLRFKEIVTEQINTYLHPYYAGFLLGMLFGDKTNLDADIQNDFRATGISHLLSVSGLHTSTWCLYIIILLKLFKIKEKVRNIFCLLFLVLLCITSAFTPSVLRAAFMMAVVLIAPFFKKEQDSLNSLGFAVSILTLHNPYIITSVSFLLSVFSTLGVLLSYTISKYIVRITKKFRYTVTAKIFEYISNSLIISVFSVFFTLPITAYFFRAFGIMAPITNLICIKPAFWSLISGVTATAASFIPHSIGQSISVFIFKISVLFASLVTGVADYLAEFRFCTLPIHKEYFLFSIILITVILFMYFTAFRTKKNRSSKIIVTALCVISFTLCTVLPCTETLPSAIYVTNVENGINITLRQGLKYSHFNCGASDDTVQFNYLPATKCESLDFLYIGKADIITNEATKYLFKYTPETTLINKFTKGVLNKSSIEFPQNTIIENTYTHRFNNEITVQVVDTYPVGCVIIRSSEKTVLISYGMNYSLDSLFKAYGKPDVLVLGEHIPKTLPENIDTLIISSGSEIITNKNLLTLKKQCNKMRTTTENGNIKILL